MLVTFSCPAYADITMFSDVAIRMIKMMGHSGTVPGAISAEEVQAAQLRLQAGVEQSPEPQALMEDEEDRGAEPFVSLAHRALPLLELLSAADKDKCNVMWDSNN